jgi:prevent-host-death family protein
MANRVQVARFRKDFANIVNRSARGERIKLTRYGTTLAVIVPKADLQRLEDCEQGVAPESTEPRLAPAAPPRNSPGGRKGRDTRR